MLFCVLLFINLFFVHGFLLNTISPQSSAGQGNGQCLSFSDYYDDQRIQQRKLDKTLALLTSQIQQTFTALEQKIQNGNTSQNQTTDVAAIESKYQLLEQDHKELQANFDSLKSQYTTQNVVLNSLRNKITEHENEIADLKMLKNVQPIQDLQNLKLQMQEINTQTHNLNVNQQARNQDFLALYNQTIDTRRTLNELANKHDLTSEQINNQSIRLQKSNTEMEDIRRKLNATVNELNKTISTFTTGTSAKFLNQSMDIKDDLSRQKLDAKLLDTRLSILEQTVANESARVALTACARSGSYSSHEVIKFPIVRTKFGINNVTAFQSTGKFTCEKTGLYLISTSIVSTSTNVWVQFMKNGSYISWAYVSNVNHLDTGTAVPAIELQIGDTLWVQPGYSFVEYNGWSCMTIIKVQ